MEKIRVELEERSYYIYIGNGILDGIGEKAGGFGFTHHIALISNPTVFALYGARVMKSLESAGFTVSEVIIPDGEQYKDFMWVNYIMGELLKLRLDRKSAIVALGGGVVGDIACFAASIYMRGIACIQVPTTLLSQVDSSVGGKTGVNHFLGKNMIGTFYQPSLVWIDIDTLHTLDEREFRAGMAEVIKYGVIRDAEFFEYLKTHKKAIDSCQPEQLLHVVKRSCEIKADVVSEDERESGIRAILNYGHTIGHAIESITGYTRFLHGEAVAMGMCHAAELARLSGLLDEGTVQDVSNMIKAYHLPVSSPEDLRPDMIIESMQIDKKAVAGSLRFVLPDKIGSVRIVNGLSDDLIRKSLIYKG